LGRDDKTQISYGIAPGQKGKQANVAENDLGEHGHDRGDDQVGHISERARQIVLSTHRFHDQREDRNCAHKREREKKHLEMLGENSFCSCRGGTQQEKANNDNNKTERDHTKTYRVWP
jgi:hypothetical protein